MGALFREIGDTRLGLKLIYSNLKTKAASTVSSAYRRDPAIIGSKRRRKTMLRVYGAEFCSTGMGAGALSLSTTYKASRVVNTSVTITLIIVRSTWRFFDAPVRSHPRQPHSWQRYVLCEVNRLTSFSRKPRVWDL